LVAAQAARGMEMPTVKELTQAVQVVVLLHREMAAA
jgi:hypothetical protein